MFEAASWLFIVSWFFLGPQVHTVYCERFPKKGGVLEKDSTS